MVYYSSLFLHTILWKNLRKERNDMILFITLLIMALLLAVFTVFAIAIGGSVFIVVFGDVIVCIFLIVWIIKKLIKKND